MMTIRAFAALSTIFCLVATFYRGQIDGVSLIGLLSFALFLWTCDVFTRAFWIEDDECARIDAEIAQHEQAERERERARTGTWN